MLKIFRKYQEHSEKRWFRVIEQLVRYTIKLKNEVEYLLSRFFTVPEDVDRIMNCSELTAENLAEHKRLLNLSLGAFYAQEAQRISLETEKRLLEQDINKWVKRWDEIRSNDLLLVRGVSTIGRRDCTCWTTRKWRRGRSGTASSDGPRRLNA